MGKLRRILSTLDKLVVEHADAVALAALTIGLVWRVMAAAETYLNPDEAAYFRMSVPESFRGLYGRARLTHHPVFPVVLIHFLRKISEHELCIRFASIAAGTLFPWFLYRWIGLVWNQRAGLAALLLGCFAPIFMSLGEQARGYTLAYLGICACLYFLERAVQEGSARWMMLSMGALWLGIVSEFFVAFFAGAVGISFLWRTWRERLPARLLWVWAAGQCVGLGLYFFMYVTQIRVIAAGRMGDATAEEWLHGMFPWPGESVVWFLVSGVGKQFAGFMASPASGALIAIPFVVGIVMLWRGREEDGGWGRRMVVGMTALLFAFTGAGAIGHFHPFGDSRHTAFLGLFLAGIAGVGLERLFRAAPGMLLPAALLLIPAWHVEASIDPHEIVRYRHQKSDMVAGVGELKRRIPEGAKVLVDGQTRYLLDFYLELDRGERLRQQKRNVWISGGYELVSYRYAFNSAAQAMEDAGRLRQEYGMPAGEAVWLVVGGWSMFDPHGAADREVMPGEVAKFGDVLGIYRIPAGKAADAEDSR